MRKHEVAAIITSHLLERNLLRISCENEQWDFTSHRYVCAETGEPCPLLSPWRPFGRCPLEIAIKEVLSHALTANLEEAIARHLKIEAHGDITQAELPKEIPLAPPFVLRITKVEKPTWRLLPEDHTKSLLFIERLLGHKIDRARLNSVEREMAKVKHGLEELYGI